MMRGMKRMKMMMMRKMTGKMDSFYCSFYCMTEYSSNLMLIFNEYIHFFFTTVSLRTSNTTASAWEEVVVVEMAVITTGCSKTPSMRTWTLSETLSPVHAAATEQAAQWVISRLCEH